MRHGVFMSGPVGPSALRDPSVSSFSSLSRSFAPAKLLSCQGSDHVSTSPALPWQRVFQAGPLLLWVPSKPCLQPGKCSHPIQVAQEKLRAEICEQVNTCNMLLYKVKQRSQAREQLQRRLQQLQMDAQMDDKQHQAQVPGPLPGVVAPVGVSVNPCTPGWALGSVHGVTPCPQPSLPQVVRTLENNIEKMQTKVRAAQKVAALYMVVRDALRKVSSSSLCHCPTRSPAKALKCPRGCAGGTPSCRRSSCSPPSPLPAQGTPGTQWGDVLWLPVSQELAHLPLHLDLLSEMAKLQHEEVEDMELMALDGLRAARVTKVRWSRAPQGVFLTSRAHRWHHVSRLLSLPSRKSKRLSWASPQHTDASIAPPTSGSWARLPWRGDSCLKHWPWGRWHAPFSSRPCSVSFPGCFRGVGSGIFDAGHAGSPSGSQRSIVALGVTSFLLCSRSTWPGWKPSSLQRESSGTAPWLLRKCP